MRGGWPRPRAMMKPFHEFIVLAILLAFSVFVVINYIL
jgi:hypothetical protein